MSYKHTASATIAAQNASMGKSGTRFKGQGHKGPVKYSGWKKFNGPVNGWEPIAEGRKSDWEMEKPAPRNWMGTPSVSSKGSKSWADIACSAPPPNNNESSYLNHDYQKRNSCNDKGQQSYPNRHDWWNAHQRETRTCDKCHGWGFVDKEVWSKEEICRINSRSKIHEMLDYVKRSI